MNCCDHVQPLIDALVELMAYTDKLYLADDLRTATTRALVAKANAEVRTCTLCWKNCQAGGTYAGVPQ